MAKKAILLVPLTYNDGSAVPDDVLDGIYDALFQFSGGHTSLGPVRGAFRMQDGTKQTDVLEQVWLVYEEGDEEALRDLIRGFCATLGQEAMYLEFTESVIEMIQPSEE
jgi:hypothetical protein